MKILTAEELRKMVPQVSDQQAETQKFYNGDAWQNGNGWIGPTLSPQDDHYGEMQAEIKKLFTSQNIIKETVDRIIAGLVSAEPEWSVTVSRELDEDEAPTEEEQALIDEAENWLRRWWAKDQGLVAAEDMLWSPVRIFKRALALSLQIGRAPLRMFLPVERWSESGDVGPINLPTLEEDEAIESVFVHLPDAYEADVHINHKTLQAIGVYQTRDEANVLFHELHSLENRKAVIQQYKNFELIGETKLDLNGNPTMIEVGMPEIIDESIRSQQRAVNMILTMLARNSVQAGFLERVILNGQLPGEERIDPVTGEVHFTPVPFSIGPGRTAFVPGIETEQPDGTTTYANPSISYRDPVPTQTFVDSITHLYKQILHSVHQSHVFEGAGPDASGESRKQSRADFEMILKENAETVRSSIAWMLETALSMIAILAGRAGAFNDLEVNVTIHPYAGPISAEEKKADIQQVESKIISKRTARIRSGVHDSDAEERQILAEQENFGDSEMESLAAILKQPPDVEVDMPPAAPDAISGNGSVTPPNSDTIQRGDRSLEERTGMKV